MRRTFTGCIMISAAHPRWNCVPPGTPCPLGSYIQRSSSRLLINGGGCAPLERFCNLLQNRPQTPEGFARLRSTSQHAASGLQEFILQTTLTSARGLPRRSLTKTGADRPCCCWQTTSTSFATAPFQIFVKHFSNECKS